MMQVRGHNLEISNFDRCAPLCLELGNELWRGKRYKISQGAILEG